MEPNSRHNDQSRRQYLFEGHAEYHYDDYNNPGGHYGGDFYFEYPYYISRGKPGLKHIEGGRTKTWLSVRLAQIYRKAHEKVPLCDHDVAMLYLAQQCDLYRSLWQSRCKAGTIYVQDLDADPVQDQIHHLITDTRIRERIMFAHNCAWHGVSLYGWLRARRKLELLRTHASQLVQRLLGQHADILSEDKEMNLLIGTIRNWCQKVGLELLRADEEGGIWNVQITYRNGPVAQIWFNPNNGYWIAADPVVFGSAVLQAQWYTGTQPPEGQLHHLTSNFLKDGTTNTTKKFRNPIDLLEQYILHRRGFGGTGSAITVATHPAAGTKRGVSITVTAGPQGVASQLRNIPIFLRVDLGSTAAGALSGPGGRQAAFLMRVFALLGKDNVVYIPNGTATSFYYVVPCLGTVEDSPIKPTEYAAATATAV